MGSSCETERETGTAITFGTTLPDVGCNCCGCRGNWRGLAIEESEVGGYKARGGVAAAVGENGCGARGGVAGGGGGICIDRCGRAGENGAAAIGCCAVAGTDKGAG